jgi:hypothetical protein
VRKSLVDAVGGFDVSLRKSPDWDLWQRVARTGARFGHVDETLAFYRMQPNSSSLDARQLLADGLQVLQRGHAPDPRVLQPHPDHANGLPGDNIECQKFYLLCWCAGLLLGAGDDARPLFELIGEAACPRLYPDAIAQCIFDAAPLPSCQTPQAWEDLWRSIWRNIDEFVVALETRSRTPDLAGRTLVELKKLVLKHAPMWQPLIEHYEDSIARQHERLAQLELWRTSLEQDRDRWQRQAGEREQVVADKQRCIEGLERDRADQASARVQRPYETRV